MESEAEFMMEQLLRTVLVQSGQLSPGPLPEGMARVARHRSYRTTATERSKARATLRVARACCSGTGNELSG